LEVLEDRDLPSTFTVDHLADDLVGSGLNGSLRYCITHAAYGDHIQFAVTGTINLTGSLPALHDIDLEGPGAGLLTVRRDTGGYYSVFHATPGTYTYSTTIISGMTITNGSAFGSDNYAGGIYVDHGRLTLNDAIVSGNFTTGWGGGIQNNDGEVALNNTTVSGNSAVEAGGGIFNAGTLAGTLTLNNSTVSNNAVVQNYQCSDAYGGGIYNYYGTVTLNNVTVSNNAVAAPFTCSHANGGGIYNWDGTVTLSNATVSGNAAESYGGGIFNTVPNPYHGRGTLTLNSSTVSGNSAVFAGRGDGGGIYNYYNATTVTLNNVTVSGNAADIVGGIQNIAAPGSNANATVMLLNSTVADNTSGSGTQLSSIHLGQGQSGTVQLRNTVVAGNGPGPNLSGSGYGPPFLSQGHNLSSDDGSGFLTGPGDLTNTDPLLGPLQDNGGPTQTMALLAGSPALNAGDPAQLGVADQRGVGRSGGVNIGAYQASASAFVLTAPDTVSAGVPFGLTVTAVDPFGQVAPGCTGTITFRTTDPDPGVVLPADSTFTPEDGGAHTFTDTGRGETTLVTPGDQTLTVTDTADDTLTGSAIITVGGTAPGAGSHGPGQPPQPSRLQASTPQSQPPTQSEAPRHVVVAVDRLLASLSEGDATFAWSRQMRHLRAEADSWALDPLRGDDPLFF
jgi:hypothetical protein